MSRGLAMSGHQAPHRGATDVWLTPPAIVGALGPFDLDPCAAVGQPWTTAARQFTIEDDGLAQTWDGFVWCNPPYGPEWQRWLHRLADHGDGIALIFARTETAAFVEAVWERATALRFIHGRLHFHRPNGERARANAGAPSVLVGYGPTAADRLRRADIAGTFILLDGMDA